MPSAFANPASQEHPTGVRYWVVVLAILLGMVTYLDRACIATLATHIRSDLHLSEYEMGWAFTVFAVAYGAFGIPAAYWADRVGTRKMLTLVVIWWSISTMLTGAAWSLSSLVAIRFVFGIGEAGAWPAITRTLSRWIPYRERGAAQGVVWVGAHATAGVTPVLILMMNERLHISWRVIFLLFGLVGLAWAAAWHWWVRDEPSQHARVNAAELQYILAGRTSSAAKEECPRGWPFWRRLLTHRGVIALCLMYMPNSFVFYFCLTWLPSYLRDGRHMSGNAVAFYAGLPLLLTVFGDLFGGLATDWAVRIVGPRYGRAGVGFAAYLLAGLGMLAAAASPSAAIAATLFALGTAASMFLLGAAWGTCQDIGGGHAGVVSATMNTAGQCAAMACPLIVIFVKNCWGWDAPLAMLGISFLVGAVCWCFIDPQQKVFD